MRASEERVPNTACALVPHALYDTLLSSGEGLLIGAGGRYAVAVKLRLAAPPDFHFLSAVCSHGFFVLAPNVWHPPSRTLATAVALDDHTAALITVRPGSRGEVLIKSATTLDDRRRDVVRRSVRRILRLDERFGQFHALCRASPSHASAVEIGFGRLIRSATLFEDMVKVICTCNVTWRQTKVMTEALVEHWGVPVEDHESADEPLASISRSGRARSSAALGPSPPLKAFPTPQRLAGARESSLKSRARVGYRAAFIRRLARNVADGRIDLAALERFDGTSDELHKRLKGIHGIGDYAAGNLCMLLGRYDRLAVDTEMVRLFRERHPAKRWNPADLRAYYEHWRPYQFLAYWFELWRNYVDRHGQADQWWPNGAGNSITGNS